MDLFRLIVQRPRRLDPRQSDGWTSTFTPSCRGTSLSTGEEHGRDGGGYSGFGEEHSLWLGLQGRRQSPFSHSGHHSSGGGGSFPTHRSLAPVSRRLWDLYRALIRRDGKRGGSSAINGSAEKKRRRRKFWVGTCGGWAHAGWKSLIGGRWYKLKRCHTSEGIHSSGGPSIIVW
jgi:hypothetical protein